MRTIKEVIDDETENSIKAEDFFSKNEADIFKQRYELEKAYNQRRKLWVCPVCRQPIKIRGKSKGDGIRSMHFAHIADRLDCPIKTGRSYTEDEINRMKYNGQKESPNHERLKNVIAEQLSRDIRFSEINIEKRFDGICKDWRKPDVSAVFMGKKIVFELQLNTTFISVIAARNLFYQENQSYILWIFDNKRDNLDSMRFMEKDIAYPNHHNAFFINENYAGSQFKLICGYEKPTIVNTSINNEWHITDIDFGDLTFGSNFQIYWFNYEEKRELLLEEIEKNKFLNFGNLWRTAHNEKRLSLIESYYPVSMQQNENINFRELSFLLDCLYSLKFKQVIGYNYGRVIQLLHQYLIDDPIRKSHFGEYIFKAIRVYAHDQIKKEDKTGKLLSKANNYRKNRFELCHKYDPFLEKLFPELFIEEKQ